MTKQEKKIVDTQTDAMEASKTLVSQSRTWAKTMREVMLAPWTGATEENELVTMMVEPWVTMTRMTHDRLLDTFETQSHEMIDRSFTMMKQFQQLQQLQK